MGVVVSAGHTAANATQTERALSEGLRCFTHLFNGMPPLASREPGVVGAAINSEAWCSIIPDGHHVDDRVCAIAVRARPRSHRMIAISDAMSTVGGPGQFKLYGETIRVSEGRLVNAAGSLAGAHIDLQNAVNRLIAKIHVRAHQSLAMAIDNPRRMLRLPAAGIVGSRLSELSQFFIDRRPA